MENLEQKKSVYLRQHNIKIIIVLNFPITMPINYTNKF